MSIIIIDNQDDQPWNPITMPWWGSSLFWVLVSAALIGVGAVLDCWRRHR